MLVPLNFCGVVVRHQMHTVHDTVVAYNANSRQTEQLIISREELLKTVYKAEI